MREKKYFTFDILQIILNVFRHGNETNNLVIISGYAVTLVKEYRQLLKDRETLLRFKFNNKIEQDKIELNANNLRNQIRQVKRVVSSSVWNSILDRRVIVYIHNQGHQHWNCTYIFNLKHYIIEYDHKVAKNENVLKNEELSGF